jgi:hypothetical protein
VFWPSLMLAALATLLHVALRLTGATDDVYLNYVHPLLNVPEHGTYGELPRVVFIIDAILDRLLGFATACFIAAGLVAVLECWRLDHDSARSARTAWLATAIFFALWEAVIQPVNMFVQWAYDRSRGTTKPNWTMWYDDVALGAVLLGLAVAATVGVLQQIRWAGQHANRHTAMNRSRRLSASRASLALFVCALCALATTDALGPATVLLIAVVLFRVAGQVWWLTRQANAAVTESAAPRLIVVPAALECLVVYGCVLSVLTVIDSLGIMDLRWGPVSYRWLYLVYTIVAAGVIAGSVLFRNVIHILMDIIIHFRTFDSDRLIPTSLSGPTFYPIRARIAGRLRDVLNLSLRKCPTHLLIIAHSQGTVIALEELCSPEWQRRFADLKSVTLLTFGSPLTHIYQEYLPRLYGPLTTGRWVQLRQNVPRWVNLYRLDDYVGTRIDSSVPNWPVNVPLQPGLRLGGHTHYWTCEVFAMLAEGLP